MKAPRTSRQKSSRNCILSALLVMGVCLLLAAAAYYVAIRIPAQALVTFGPPAPDLPAARVTYYSFMLTRQQDVLLRPAAPAGSEIHFTIQPGDPASLLATRLEQAGLIADSAAFTMYLSYSGLDTTIQAGEYTLSPAMTPLQIAHALQDATPSEVDFVIIPGWRLEEIAAQLPTSGLAITPAEFLLAAQTIPITSELTVLIPAGSGLEGFLMPGTYALPRVATVAQLFDAPLDAFSNTVTSDLREGFARQDLSLYQAVTLASLVEREAVLDDEMPMIASVFYNRLQAGMELASDPTVQYAIGFNPDQQTWWTNPLRLDDLQIISAYNTYLNPGLPPGPIASPGIQALQAVALPAETPYYYFRAACDGSGRHLFAETFQEHIQNECP